LAALTPIIFNTTEAAILRFTPHERGCYTDDEFKLKILSWEEGYKYSLMNCFYSALIETIARNCSCAPQMFGIISGYPDLVPCR
jgi:hypothetical protein